MRQRIDFADLLVGHGVTAARGAIAVNHEKRAMAVVGAIIGVREAGIDRPIVIGSERYLLPADEISCRLQSPFSD